ncbi:MAG: TrmB family transcriptional regulator [Halobacteriaceae archaeon]
MADLRDLGLSEYEARAYRALLATGPTTARELSEASDVPMGRIYDVLNDLETQGLARSRAAGRPKKYVAVDPDPALDRLLEARRQDLEETAARYAETVEELKTDLEAGAVDSEGFWTAVVGPDAVLDLLCERLETASERVVMVAGPVSTGFDLGEVGERVADALEAATDREVDVRLLVAYGLADALPPSLADRYTALTDREGFAVRVTSDVSGAVTVVDSEVCVEVANPIEPDTAFAMVDVADPEFAADVVTTVDDRWSDASPL